MEMLSMGGREFKVKHSKNSGTYWVVLPELSVSTGYGKVWASSPEILKRKLKKFMQDLGLMQLDKEYFYAALQVGRSLESLIEKYREYEDSRYVREELKQLELAYDAARADRLWNWREETKRNKENCRRIREERERAKAVSVCETSVKLEESLIGGYSRMLDLEPVSVLANHPKDMLIEVIC